MKFTIIMKTPDALDQIIPEIKDDLKEEGLEGDEYLEAVEDKIAEVRQVLAQWLKYGEVVRIEFNTEANTATVLPARP